MCVCARGVQFLMACHWRLAFRPDPPLPPGALLMQPVGVLNFAQVQHRWPRCRNQTASQFSSCQRAWLQLSRPHRPRWEGCRLCLLGQRKFTASVRSLEGNLLHTGSDESKHWNTVCERAIRPQKDPLPHQIYDMPKPLQEKQKIDPKWTICRNAGVALQRRLRLTPWSCSDSSARCSAAAAIKDSTAGHVLTGVSGYEGVFMTPGAFHHYAQITCGGFQRMIWILFSLDLKCLTLTALKRE